MPASLSLHAGAEALGDLDGLGYVEHDSFEGQFSEIFDQILAYERGAPIHVVNPDVLRA